MENKLATEIKDLLNSTKSFFRTIFGKSDRSLAYQDDKKSKLDELLIFIWFLIVCCVCVVTWFSYSYHASILAVSDTSYEQKMLIAIAFTVIADICKVLLLHKGGGYLFGIEKGKFGLLDFVLMCILGVIVWGAYSWSMDISSRAYGENVSQISKKTAMSKTGSTKEIDKKYASELATQDEIIKTGKNTTWAGRVTEDGRNMMTKANAEKARINKRKSDEIAKMYSRDSSSFAQDVLIIDSNKSQLNQYGGKAEWLCFLAVLLILIIEKKQIEKRKEEGGQGPDDGQGQSMSSSSQIGFRNSNQGSFSENRHENKPNFQGKSERPQIGFKQNVSSKAGIIEKKKKI